MSWDIFVQDLPADIKSIDDIPDDFEPGPIGNRSELIAQIMGVVPFADFSDPTWGQIEGADFSIEVSMGDSEIVEGFTFHVSGSSTAAAIVVDILDRLKLRALDPGADGSIFDMETAKQSMDTWRQYRDQVVANP